VAEARAHLEATGYGRVRVECADGWSGFRAGAPYDRIILTVGVHDLAPAWVEQLRDGGLLVAPLSFGSAQFVPAFRRRGDHLTSEQIRSGFFMDLRGEHPRQMTHRSGEGLTVAHDALSDTALAAVNEILDRPAELFSAPELVEVGTAWAEFQNFWTFVALFHPLAIQIDDPRVRAQGIQGMAYAIADLERRQLALTTACLGGPEIGQELRRLAREWLEMGRPGLDRLVIAAYPRAVYPRADVLPRGHWSGLIEKEHTWFRWRYRQGREQSGQA
jgi:hypothetical protein